MKILVVSVERSWNNLGDVAMLIVAIERLKALWPGATISVLTSNPGVLAGHCVEVTPVLNRWRGLWFSNESLSGSLGKYLPSSGAAMFGKLHGTLRDRNPKLLECLIRVKLAAKGEAGAEFQKFVNAFSQADVVVACGQAGLNDHIAMSSSMLLELMGAACRRKKLTAMFSQGIGPLRSPRLIEECKAVLPRIDLIALREGSVGEPFLRSIGVCSERVRVTGDDAIEMAYKRRPMKLGDAIGVSLRLGGYAGVESKFIETLRTVLQRLAASHMTRLAPLPTLRTELRDAKAIRLLLNDPDYKPDESESLDTPLKVVAVAGRCRVVIAGAYHAAVFALSQGIPVVGLVNSEYTLNRFRGLAEQFGTGCEIVWLGADRLEDRMTMAFAKVWDRADKLRPLLLEAAARQVQAGQHAYRYLYECSRTHESATRSGRSTGVRDDNAFVTRPGRLN